MRLGEGNNGGESGVVGKREGIVGRGIVEREW